MKMKRLISFICAVCMTGCIAPYNSSISLNFISKVSAADSSNEVKFTAIGQYTQVKLQNTTETPAWYSDNVNVASVDSNGKITAVGEGSCTVYAVFSNQMLSFPITVTLPEEVTDIIIGNINLSNEKPGAELTVSGVDLTDAVWSSTDTSVASVSSKGVITAVGSGNCKIIASLGGKNYIINVSSSYVPSTGPAVTEVNLGTLELSNGSSSAVISLNGVPAGTIINWSSTDESVASVTQDGKVTAVNKGECQIIAVIDGIKYITIVKSSYDPTIVKPTVVNLGDMKLTNSSASGTIKLSGVPEGAEIIWSSTDENVASVDQSGKVTAVGSGNCQIIALINGIKYTMNVTSEYVPKAEPEISTDSTVINGIGSSISLTIKNTDEKPQWISTDLNVATVDENGIVTAVGKGTVVIIANVGGKPYSITITVNDRIIYGDVNNNGEVDITDAAKIMSYVSNSEKYPLNDKQLDIADVNQRGDGISNMDSLAVQKYLAQIIKSLPES